MTVTHFLPTIGNLLFTCDELGLKNKYCFSFDDFKDRNEIFKLNRKENLTVLKDFKFKGYVKDNNIEPTDIQISIPPCKGLSQIASNAGIGNPNNIWIYESIKWFIAQNNTALLLENALELSYNKNREIIRNIWKLLQDTGRGYKINLIKTAAMCHGVPQRRRRTILFIHKSSKLIKLKHIPFAEKDVFIYLNEIEKMDNTLYPDTIEWRNASKWLKFIKQKGLVKKIRETDLGRPKNLLAKFIVEYAEDKNYFGDFGYLKKVVDRVIKKEGGGNLLVFPQFRPDYTPAFNYKNVSLFLHPKYDRFLSLREVMYFMGLPPQFKLVFDNMKWKMLYRTCPGYMLKDFLKIAMNVLTKSEKGYIIMNGRDTVMIQDNLDGAMKEVEKW